MFIIHAGELLQQFKYWTPQRPLKVLSWNEALNNIMVAYLTKIRNIHISIFRKAITSIRIIYFWSCWFVCLSDCLSVRRLHFGVIRITIWINGSDYDMDPVRVLHATFTRDVYRQRTNSLTLEPPNYSIWIFAHFKLCLADAIHSFKWVKIIQIWQNEGQLFSNL